MKEQRTDYQKGSSDLVSNEEEIAVQILKKRNLKHVNDISKPVHPVDSLYSRYGKRFLDLLIGIPALIVVTPLNAIFALCTLVDVGHPIIFEQERVGKDGKLFTMRKFRNMTSARDADGKLLPPSERVTKFGRIMRKYSLDELLNIWNVVKGDMSIVGPRPYPFFIYDRMSERHKHRTVIRPGLECPRVIHVPKEDVYRYQRTFENDIWYVENVSFRTDVKMVLLLFKMVFSLRKRDDQASGHGVSYFAGYNWEGNAMSMINYRNEMGKEADEA